ncbi:hypothetical protein OE88DRAFT_1660894 [Heliocybe sulcata]|uniref:Uncharacterized protein n=1 Tax=Heliocybe sulcata TaxID=5364 RepID=A0A5C3MY88_9AGAM|nr:hypothetical protein OE88DRAFT_1660894 [Heliocybe sulcata]
MARDRICVGAAVAEGRLWVLVCSVQNVALISPSSRTHLSEMGETTDAAMLSLFVSMQAGYNMPPVLRPLMGDSGNACGRRSPELLSQWTNQFYAHEGGTGMSTSELFVGPGGNQFALLQGGSMPARRCVRWSSFSAGCKTSTLTSFMIHRRFYPTTVIADPSKVA